MFKLFTTHKDTVTPTVVEKPKPVLLHIEDDSSKKDAATVNTHIISNSESDSLSVENKSTLPASLTKDLKDLAILTKNISESASNQTKDLISVFGTIDKDTGKKSKKKSSKKTDDKNKVETTDINPDIKTDSKKTLKVQLTTIVEQQKTLLQKIAALGNVPIFDPKKFSQLIAALPALIAWQKSGSKIPNVPTTSQSNANTAVKNTTPIKESAKDIQNNMGINLGATMNTEEKALSKAKVNELVADVEQEGFLESTIESMPENTNVSDGIAPVEVVQKTKAELEQERKKKEAEEKAWAEEVKKREKILEEKRKESEKQLKSKPEKGQKTVFKMPTKVKGSFWAGLKNKINNFGLGKQKYEFIDNLGVMMDAGLPLIDALKSLELETKIKPYKKILSTVVIAVETGNPLWRAMDGTYFFESQQVSMVKVGEEAGNLVENLRYLAEQSQKQRELKAKVKTAMIYPIIVFVMLTLIVFGLGIFVLPNLIQVILSLGVKLPFITRMIVAFTNFFQAYGLIVAPSTFGALIVLLLLHKYTSFKVVTQWCVLKIPGIGTLVNESVLSQFGVTMGGLMQAGVPITDALESLASVTSIVKFQKFYYQLLQQVRLGDSFSTSFKKIKNTDKILPGSIQQLILTGEKSGSLTKIMFKIAEIHEKKATDVAEKLPVILEPMLLLFIGSLVGTIALGVLAPIYGIVGNIGKA